MDGTAAGGKAYKKNNNNNSGWGEVNLPSHAVSKADILGNRSGMIQDRRVSFAPDVTLHSFDLVPPSDSHRKRPATTGIKDHMGVVTSTQMDTEDLEEDQDMDLTAPHKVASGDKEPVETTMDMTELQTLEQIPLENEMEFTQVQFPLQVMAKLQPDPQDTETMEMTEVFVKPEQQTQEEEDMDFTLPVNKKLNQSRPRSGIPTIPRSKRRKITIDSDELSSSYKKVDSAIDTMSPVTIPGITDPSNSTDPTEEDNRKLDSEATSKQAPYLLRQFTQDMGYMAVLEAYKLVGKKEIYDFPCLDPSKIPQFAVDKVYYLLYACIPVLVMNSHECFQLFTRIEQSMKSFENLEEQLNQYNSKSLISTYLESTSNDHVELSKNFSKLAATKSWHKWYLDNLNTLKSELEENLRILETENENLDNELKAAKWLKVDAEKLQDSIRQQIKLVKDLPLSKVPNEPKLETKIKLEALKQELLSQRINIGNIMDLRREKESLSKQIQHKREQLDTIRKDISILGASIKINGSYTDFDLLRLNNQFTKLQSMSNIIMTKLDGSMLYIVCKAIHEELKLKINLQYNKTPNMPIKDAIQVYTDVPNGGIMLKSLLRYILDTYPPTRSGDLLSYVHTVYMHLRKLRNAISEFNIVKALYPTTITNGFPQSIQWLDYDREAKTRIVYQMAFDNFVRATTESNTTALITAVVAGGRPLDENRITSRLTKNASKLAPWLARASIKNKIPSTKTMN